MANINDPNPFNNFCEGYEDFGSGGLKHLERKQKYLNKRIDSGTLSDSELKDAKAKRRLIAMRAPMTHFKDMKNKSAVMKALDPKNPDEEQWRTARKGLWKARQEHRTATKDDVFPPESPKVTNSYKDSSPLTPGLWRPGVVPYTEQEQ